MTSRPSSTSDRSQRNALRFPPRSALPSDITIDPLPLLGTSWYERGIIYWARRAGIGIVFAAAAVVYPIMIWAALRVISGSNTPLFYGLVAGEALFTIVTVSLLLPRMWRNMLNGKGATRRDTARASRAAAGIGPLAYVTSGVVAGLAVFASLLTAGLVLASFAVWLVPVPPMEQYQRARIAEQLRIRRELDQLRPRSKHYGSKSHRNSH